MRVELVGKRYARLIEPFVYENEKFSILIRDGYIYDGGTIPKFAWSIIGSPFVGGYRRATLVHDILYDTKALPKSEADNLFFDIMLEDNVKKWRAYVMYCAVRFFGGRDWKNKKPKNMRFLDMRDKR